MGRRAGIWGNHGNGWRRGLAASRLASPTTVEVGNGSGESRDWEVLRSTSLTLVCWSVRAPPSPVAWPRNAVEGSNHLEGEWPALEIVTAAVTHGNKTWKVSVYDLPSLCNGSGSPRCRVLASCGSCRDQPPVHSSSQHHPKAVET